MERQRHLRGCSCAGGGREARQGPRPLASALQSASCDNKELARGPAALVYLQQHTTTATLRFTTAAKTNVVTKCPPFASTRDPLTQAMVPMATELDMSK